LEDVRRRGATVQLIEIALVAGVLVAIVVLLFPAVRGSIAPSSRPTYDSDRRAIQRAVDAYRADPRDPTRPFPTFSGDPLPINGVPPIVQRGAPYIDFALLAGPAPFLAEPPKSSGFLNATGVYTGSYNWFVDADGRVDTIPEQGDVYP
jgi:hypothetical protein